MSFIAIIPARLASSRLPNKPLADIAGKPMIVRTAEQALLSGASQIMVATDHLDIVAVCKEYGIPACMTRPDHPSGTDRIAEVAALLGLADDAVVVNVQGDEPLIAPELIAATAALVNFQVPMATAAHPITDMQDAFNPNVVKVVLDKMGRAMYFSRATIPWDRDAFAVNRDELPPAYVALRHIGLYAYRNDFLRSYPLLEKSPLEKIEALEQLRVLWNGHAIAVHITKTSPAPGVDTIEDLIKVRKLFVRG